MDCKKPCPSCGSDKIEQIKFTMWGSFVGPWLLSHVRCVSCDYKFNGKTGRSNFWPIFIYQAVLVFFVLTYFYFQYFA